MRITDRPGRYFALCLFSPILFIVSLRIKKTYPKDSQLLFFLSFLLFVYELYWVTRSNYETFYNDEIHTCEI